MKRYLPLLAAFCAAICLISAPFVGALAERRGDSDRLAPAEDAALPASVTDGALSRQPGGSSGSAAAVPAVSSGAAVSADPAAVPGPAVSARSALVLDAEAGAVLYEKDADRESLIASTTKIMTGWLCCRLLKPDTVCTVPAEAVGVEGSSMYLQEGEEVTVRDLLLGLMLQSGNDAAVALAILCDGSEEAFVERMNREAGALGLAHTRFANPHGLDSPDNRSTARDLALLTAAALEDPLFAEIVSTREAEAAGRTLTNHNRLLRTCEGCVGVKTGYTKAAGRILVSAARRGGRLLVCVTLDAPDDWNDHRKLLDAAFAQYHDTPVARTGEELLRLRICSGPSRGAGDFARGADDPAKAGSPAPGTGLPLIAAEDFSILLLPGEELSYRFSPLMPPAEEGSGTAPALPDGETDPRTALPDGDTDPGAAAPHGEKDPGSARIFEPGAEAGTVEISVDGRPVGAVKVRWPDEG